MASDTLANASPSKREVYDLDSEKTGPNQCQIDEIIGARNDRPFNTLEGRAGSELRQMRLVSGTIDSLTLSSEFNESSAKSFLGLEWPTTLCR